MAKAVKARIQVENHCDCTYSIRGFDSGELNRMEQIGMIGKLPSPNC